jgi:hypothetical protein
MLEKRQPLPQMMLEKLDIYMQKTETRLLSLTLYKNQFKMYQSKTQYFETIAGKHLKI